jgi:hypothetical protein
VPTETIEYRPRVFLGLAFAAIFAVTAVILVWLGLILRPADRAAIDGATLLLLTVVPIRLFSWTFAAVFMFFGLRIARRTLNAEPTLVVSEASVTLPTGRVNRDEPLSAVVIIIMNLMLLALLKPFVDAIATHFFT